MVRGSEADAACETEVPSGPRAAADPAGCSTAADRTGHSMRAGVRLVHSTGRPEGHSS